MHLEPSFTNDEIEKARLILWSFHTWQGSLLSVEIYGSTRAYRANYSFCASGAEIHNHAFCSLMHLSGSKAILGLTQGGKRNGPSTLNVS
jgi:hypothetical protein